MNIEYFNNFKKGTTVIFSHNDLDGYASQFLIHKFLKSINTPDDKIIMCNCNYPDIPEYFNKFVVPNLDISKNNENRNLILTDLSLTKKIEEETEKILEDFGKRIQNFSKSNKISTILLDHHKTTEEYPFVYLNTKICATKISFLSIKDKIFNNKNEISIEEIYYGEEIYNIFAEIVNSYDLWLEDNKYFHLGKTLNEFFYKNEIDDIFMPDTKRKYLFEIFEKTLDFIYYNYDNLENTVSDVFYLYLYEKLSEYYKEAFNLIKGKDESKKTLQEKQQIIGFYQEILTKPLNKYELTFNDKSYNIVVFENMNSGLYQNVSSFMNKEDGIEFCINVKENGSVSLRGNGLVDLSELSKRYFNGGGHKKASGGNLLNYNFFDSNKLLKTIESVFELILEDNLQIKKIRRKII